LKVISDINDIILHLQKIKFDLMTEQLLIGRWGIIAVHEKEHWVSTTHIIAGLHPSIAQGRWWPVVYQYMRTLVWDCQPSRKFR
ncbi:hypothetical protein HWV62_26751, partial [Athelia sp. TMB]